MTEKQGAVIANKVMSLLFEFDCLTVDDLWHKAHFHLEQARYIIDEMRLVAKHQIEKAQRN